MEYEELLKERVKLNQKIWDIEETERAKESEALLGKCFRFRNSYGCSRPSWWLYVKVVDVEGGYPVCFEFQTDREGKISVDPGKSMLGSSLGQDGNYEPIRPSEFTKAYRLVQQRIANMSP